MESTTTVQIGPGFAGLLTITFIVLKLTHVIAWSWWWVLCPVWIPLALVAAFLLGCGVVMGLIALVTFVLR